MGEQSFRVTYMPETTPPVYRVVGMNRVTKINGDPETLMETRFAETTDDISKFINEIKEVFKKREEVE